MSEYLTQSDWEPQLPVSDPHKLMEGGLIIAPFILRRELERAKLCLRDFPGPNVERRRVLSKSWFDYWEEVCLFDNVSTLRQQDVTRNPKVVPFSLLAEKVERRNPRVSGLITYGAGEGMPHHVYCLSFMRDTLFPNGLVVLGLEPDSYMTLKSRPERFIPLPILVSLYALLPAVDLVTIMPLDLEEAHTSSYFDERFQQSGVDYGFATAGEPHAAEKAARRGMRRGELPELSTLIPRVNSYPTSAMVHKFYNPPVGEADEPGEATVFDSEWLKK